MSTHLRWIVVAVLLTWASQGAIAGIGRVKADPGTRVGIGYVYKDMSSAGQGQDVPASGEVEFIIPTQENLTNVSVAKSFNDLEELYSITLSPFGITFASLEPFEVPSFGALAPSTSLLAVFNIEDFLQQGDPFTTGQILNVTIGTVPQTSAIRFLNDAAANPNDPEGSALQLLDPSFVNALPAFTGTAQVLPRDAFSPVPEPSSLGCLILGAVGLVSRRRNR